MLTKISGIPPNPGIYIFKNAKQKVLYVGKAKNLKNRLKSYFQKAAGLDARKAAMMREAGELSYIVTGNELEAFVLEANLIKQYKPKFNIILRDDKNYPYLKLTVQEEWPRLEVVRKVQKDGALYFGPYVPAGSMWETLAFIRRNFRIRDCNYLLDKPMRPCIQHQMGKCLAPCAGLISRKEYLKLVEQIRLFLSGGKKDLMDTLEKKMLKLSEQMRFEEAAELRDRIRAIERAWEEQKVVDPRLGDIDVIGLWREGNEASLKVFFIRNGVMIGSRDFFLKKVMDTSDAELMNTFIKQLYSKNIIPPSEIVTPVLPEETVSLRMWLSKRKEKSVRILSPRYGRKRDLITMATENARLVSQAQKEIKADDLTGEIQERLKLKAKPEDIGAFDVSNISGNEAVGAFVCWAAGIFRKEKYRRLKIKTVQGVDDYSMMEEIVGRIIHNLEGELPDLVLIDGGKGHLETARKVFEKNISAFKKIPELIAVAKDPDRVYLSDSDEPVDIEDGRQSSLLLKSIRDEAHRFAIEYHRKLREKGFLQSPLDKIKGIGKKRRLELLRVFGSIENIKNATIEDIAQLKGFHKVLAGNLLHELRRTE